MAFLVAESDVGAAQAFDGGLGRGERAAQVVAHRGEQGDGDPAPWWAFGGQSVLTERTGRE
jgi:hypothetical protein